ADRLQAARVARVAVGHLLLELLSRERDLLRVHDDDEVAGVDVVGEGRLVLAAQDRCGVRGQPAEDDVGGVDDDPVALDLPGLRGVSARHDSAAFLSNGEVRESRSGVLRRGGSEDPSWSAEDASGGLTFVWIRRPR
ncbi:hypothetical protein ABE10_02415, partial [Bacillus toyonensis]|nr:hypothetical protein [Bacillus toyonensis]